MKDGSTFIFDDYQRLHKNEDLFAHLQRIARVGCWEFDPVKQGSNWSAELFRIYGIENTGFITMQKVLEYIHPDDEERFSAAVRALSAGELYDSEFRIIRPDGEVRTLHSKREMIVDEGEIRLIGITQDITDQKHTQELLLKSEKLSAVGQLAAGVAHEIRNPLTALKGFLKLIPNANDPQRYIEIMENELNRIEAVTNELLVLAKPQVLQFKLVDITQNLTNVAHLLNTQAILKSIELSISVEDAVPSIHCEPSQVEQVFINVIKNAIEATPVGGRVTVRVGRCSDEDVIIRVMDNGPGIPQDDIKRLGEPFYTTKENGTGLGLMVSQRMIANHHGRLDISSQVGKGTTVTVVFPCRQDILPTIRKTE